jgi:hypothetical protein
MATANTGEGISLPAMIKLSQVLLIPKALAIAAFDP